jgi:hypothetical protein
MLALIVVSSATSANAGSIDVIKTNAERSGSIERIRCESCLRETEVKKAASVIELAPGTQKIEIREVDGVRKVFRTEAWMGGSPVVYVSKSIDLQPPVVAEEKPVMRPENVADAPAVITQPQPAQAEADMIDQNAKTSAVTADMGANTKVEIKAPAFDPAKLQLRLN